MVEWPAKIDGVYMKRHPLRGNHCHKDARFILEVRSKKAAKRYIHIYIYILNFSFLNRDSIIREFSFWLYSRLSWTILRVQNIVHFYTYMYIYKKKGKKNLDGKRILTSTKKKTMIDGRSSAKFSSLPWLERTVRSFLMKHTSDTFLIQKWQ